MSVRVQQERQSYYQGAVAIASDAALTWEEENYPLEFEIGRLGELYGPWDVEFVRKGALLQQPRPEIANRFNNCIISSIGGDSVAIRNSYSEEPIFVE